MFYNILDKKRNAILPLLEPLKKEFYLAGGTALALQTGYRDSIDFDFFCEKSFKTSTLFNSLEKIFKDHKILKVQEEKNTLTIIIDDNIKFSFFKYKYMVLEPFIIEPYIKIATVEDIACMKLSAIVGRSTQKDYVDLYFILQEFTLTRLLEMSRKKFPELDTNLIIKSLAYFDDIIEESIIFTNDNYISFNEIKKFLSTTIKKYFI